MAQIVESGFNATAAMFALWFGVMAVIAVYPNCAGLRTSVELQQQHQGALSDYVLTG